MDLLSNLQLVCPIRGTLKVSKKSKDGLTPTEEFYRVEAIKFLVSKGYPKENFWIEPIIKKFGNNGRNSFRSDFAVLDVNRSLITSDDPDELLAHALIVCEVKRDNRKFDYVKQTQVKPILDFARSSKTIALYWDNVDKRVFWNVIVNGLKETKDGPLSFVPKFGNDIETIPYTFSTITPAESLIDIFNRIEDILHQASFSPERRYEIILQLLLEKIFDEHAFETRPDLPIEIQDFESLGTPADVAKKNMDGIVKRAVSFYEKHLPNKISKELLLSGDTLFEILKILAPVKIIHSKRDVVQTFYMKFAKDLYKWDMAQYFTPTRVTDFIVDVINPQFGEHVIDPACGSADFLVAAFRVGRHYNPGFADCVWGVDNSPNAVQIAVLNMVLNGDGKTNISRDDSLESIDRYTEKYDVVVCNPPFGSKIVEKRKNVLRKFDLGFDWIIDDSGHASKTENLLVKQETGLLFLEACIKECHPLGRIAIILPNGYLGNRSQKYRVAREWLLKNARVAAIISLPRFTFKSSGADVSASVVYLEKRERPLQQLSDENYNCAIEMIEKVGWDAGNKKGAPIYMKDQEDGSLIINDKGEPIIDCDFDVALSRIISSNASNDFEWLKTGRTVDSEVEGWAINIQQIYNDADLTLDPKRYSRKVIELRRDLMQGEFVFLGDIVDFLPEKRSSTGKAIKLNLSTIYQYVELQDIGYGDYYTCDLRGWELPSRAKHFAEPDDIFFGSIWGSASKWCYIAKNSTNVVVTNGCYRCRMKENMRQYLPDLLAYINSEGWGVQMRAFARGSDGLAEISSDDAKKVVIPHLSDLDRASIEEQIINLHEGKNTINAIIKKKLREKSLGYHDPEKRPSHIVLV